jgi:hypothetical protein
VDRNFLAPGEIYDNYSTINANALIFIRDMVVYLEFCAAIKEGDVGRIEEILKRITIMLQSGKHSNYALELLRLRFNIQHRWSENRKNAIFSSLLMNTKGLPHRWIPSDMYQASYFQTYWEEERVYKPYIYSIELSLHCNCTY